MTYQSEKASCINEIKMRTYGIQMIFILGFFSAGLVCYNIIWICLLLILQAITTPIVVIAVCTMAIPVTIQASLLIVGVFYHKQGEAD